jgi:hypothetical protein
MGRKQRKDTSDLTVKILIGMKKKYFLNLEQWLMAN